MGSLGLKAPLFRLLVMPLMIKEIIFSKSGVSEYFQSHRWLVLWGRSQEGRRNRGADGGLIIALGFWMTPVPFLAQFLLLCLTCTTHSSIVIRYASRRNEYTQQLQRERLAQFP